MNNVAEFKGREIETNDLRSIAHDMPNAAIVAMSGVGGGANLYRFDSTSEAEAAIAPIRDDYEIAGNEFEVFSPQESIDRFCEDEDNEDDIANAHNEALRDEYEHAEAPSSS